MADDRPVLFTLEWTPAFAKSAARYLKRHPEMTGRFESALAALERDPNDPKLRLHALQGRLAGCHAIRISYGDRVVVSLMLCEKRIVLLDAGSHDDVY